MRQRNRRIHSDKDSSVPLMHHDPNDLGLICLVKKRINLFRIFLKNRILTITCSNPTGHNCSTFAKMMLRDLNDPYIELPEDGLGTWIGSATSRYLVDKQLRSGKWYKTQSFSLMFWFLAGIGAAYFLFKTV